MIGIGVIGYGYWGPNLVRNFQESPRLALRAVADREPSRLRAAAKRYPGVDLHTEAERLIGDPRIDAVAIATPTASHYSLALAALEAGKHVWIEKPITATSQEAERLIELAAARQRVLHVDHTFLYTGAVRKLGQLITSGKLGKLYYYDSVRVNLGLFQHDVNVLWDLAVHDLSIMDFALGQRPCAVSATGIAHLPGQRENISYLTCLFDNQLIAHIHVNWLAPVKIRQTLIGGDRKMVIYNDLEPSEKIKVYDSGVTVDDEGAIYERMVGYRTGDMWAPQLERTEALQVEADHFVDCIEHDTASMSDGEAGLRIVKLLEAADRSLAERGRPIELAW